jgi:hypothetical protein
LRIAMSAFSRSNSRASWIDVRHWHIASFRCPQQFGRFQTEADISRV